MHALYDVTEYLPQWTKDNDCPFLRYTEISCDALNLSDV